LKLLAPELSGRISRLVITNLAVSSTGIFAAKKKAAPLVLA